MPSEFEAELITTLAMSNKVSVGNADLPIVDEETEAESGESALFH